jgi:hypothetical protein
MQLQEGRCRHRVMQLKPESQLMLGVGSPFCHSSPEFAGILLSSTGTCFWLCVCICITMHNQGCLCSHMPIIGLNFLVSVTDLCTSVITRENTHRKGGKLACVSYEPRKNYRLICIFCEARASRTCLCHVCHICCLLWPCSSLG